MQLPVKAKVTSSYGKREEDKIVSADHYGIDLGVVIGTTVVAAMEGKVTLVSNEGEYGTHVKIVNKDITTIYAHCSKILVKKGAKIKNCVIMQNCKIDPGVVLENVIFDKNVRISNDKELKGDKDYPMVIEKNQKL